MATSSARSRPSSRTPDKTATGSLMPTTVQQGRARQRGDEGGARERYSRGGRADEETKGALGRLRVRERRRRRRRRRCRRERERARGSSSREGGQKSRARECRARVAAALWAGRAKGKEAHTPPVLRGARREDARALEFGSRERACAGG